MSKIFKEVDWSIRLKATSIHLCLSAMIGVLAAVLVFGMWYPWPYGILAGGQKLFILIMSVDLVLGPLLTFVVFSRHKKRSVLLRDLTIIAVLQLGGLAYGIHTVFVVRPVAVVFEGTRFRIVNYLDVVQNELPKALPEFQSLSMTGPKFLGTRQVRNNDEKFDSINLALRGVDIGMRPMYWTPYHASSKAILKEARPLSALYKQYPDSVQYIKKEAEKNAAFSRDLKFLPVISKELDWSVLVDGTSAEVIGYVPYNGFF